MEIQLWVWQLSQWAVGGAVFQARTWLLFPSAKRNAVIIGHWNISLKMQCNSSGQEISDCGKLAKKCIDLGVGRKEGGVTPV